MKVQDYSQMIRHMTRDKTTDVPGSMAHELKMASAESDAVKDMMNKQYGPGTMKYGSEIPQPSQRQDVIEIDAINRFMRDNPMADGGRIGFDNGGTSKIQTKTFKYPKKFYNRTTGKVETVYSKKPPISNVGVVSEANLAKSEASFKAFEDRFGKELLDEIAQSQYNKNFRDLAKNTELKFFKKQLNKYEDFILENKRYPNKSEATKLGIQQSGRDLGLGRGGIKGDIEKFIKTRDTKGVGGYGMYDNFDDMPAGLKAAELISRIKKPGGGIDYERAEIFGRLKHNVSYHFTTNNYTFANAITNLANSDDVSEDRARYLQELGGLIIFAHNPM